jgi:cytochrome c
MKRVITVVAVALAATLFQLSAFANERLAQKYACAACHQAERKVVGPSWAAIRDKYKDGSVSAEQLGKTIKAGSTGKWGPVPMPAQPAVTDADAQALAAWILQKK